jgi:hypothetical protein
MLDKGGAVLGSELQVATRAKADKQRGMKWHQARVLFQCNLCVALVALNAYLMPYCICDGSRDKDTTDRR